MAESSTGWVNHQRVFFTYTVSAVTQGSTHCTVSVTAYLQMDGSSSSNGTYAQSWYGHWGSGSQSPNWNLPPNGLGAIASGSYSIPLTDSVQSLGFGATGRSYWGALSHEVYPQVPARFALTPTAVVVTRVSDTQHTISWTRNSTYTAVVVQRSTDNSTWVQVGRPTGNVASFTDTTTVAGTRYYYRVAGVGGSGQSAWSATAGPVYTTPAAPTGVAAARTGMDIVVAAASLPPFITSVDIEDGGAVVASGVNLPWTHLGPSPSVPHAYKVRGKIGALNGEWSVVSNTVQLLTPPLAPSGLTPNGAVVASDVPVRIEWTHNPVDTSPQKVFELRFRPLGGGWTTVSGATTSYLEEMPPALGVFEWQVRTKGDHADWSPWSAVATFTAITRPGVAVQGTGSWDRPVLPVSWTWLQAQGRPQSAWQVELFNDLGERLEFREGSGAASSALLETRLVDGGSYTVVVHGATGSVWSAGAVLVVSVAFVPPAPAVVLGEWDEGSGSVGLTIHDGSTAPGSPAPSTETVDVERSVDGGLSWVPLLTGTSSEVSVTDWESLSRGTTIYRVTAYADTGAASTVEYPVVANSSAIWLSGGDGYARTARLPFEPDVKIDAGRARSVERYEGRSFGVAYAGEQLTQRVDVSGIILSGDVWNAQVDALIALSQDPAPLHMYRDPDGRRIYGSLSGVALPRGATTAQVWGYGFVLEETDH